MKHYNEDYFEIFNENELKRLADHYNIAIEFRDTSIESAWEFAKLDDRRSYDFNIGQVAFWETMAEFWKSQGHKEKIYVLED